MPVPSLKDIERDLIQDLYSELKDETNSICREKVVSMDRIRWRVADLIELKQMLKTDEWDSNHVGYLLDKFANRNKNSAL